MGEPRTLAAILDQADALSDSGARELFSPGDIRELASHPGIGRALAEIVRTMGEPLGRRLAAIEALTQGPWPPWRPTPADSRAAAQVLADALATTRSHNQWGLPGAYVGRAGKIFCYLPVGVLESLRPLLDDCRPLTIYGSEAATMQSLSRYRICDLAAYLIACRLHRPWIDDPDPAVRDIEIDRYRAEIG